MTTAKNAGRINVWPSYDIAREADTAESKFIGRLTVWRTIDEARAHTSHEEEEEGGGGEPEWVPEGAKIHIDLVNDRAWTEADGDVDIDTLLGADANTETGWSETAYDEENLTADGYLQAGTPVALIGVARSAVLAGATVRFLTKQVGGTTSDPSFVLLSAEGNDAVEFDLVPSGDRGAKVSSWNGPLSSEIQNIANSADGACNCFAFTVTDTRADIAANGSDAVVGFLDNTDRPSENPLVAALFDVSSTQAAQTVTLYDALPSTAGLSALSETGVTNTAPSSVTGTWANVTELTSTTAEFSGGFGNLVVLEQIAAVDPEGNPCEITLVDDDGGTFIPGLVGGVIASISTTDDTFDPGDYAFTLRATDPGGLYVEQEFTITVTEAEELEFLVATVTVSSADLLNLHTTPKTIVAAQGANTAIVPLWGTVNYTFLTAPYTINGDAYDAELRFNGLGTPGDGGSIAVPFIVLVDGAAESILIGGKCIPAIGYAGASNKALILAQQPDSAYVDGAGSVALTIYYVVIDV